MTTIQHIHQYLPTETRMTRPLRPDVAPPTPPNKPDQMPELPRAPPYNLKPAKKVPEVQTQLPVKPPRTWLPTRAKARRRPSRRHRAADALDWSLAKPVIDMTTKAPDPHQILANQIIKMEGVLHY